ncbi:MAG: hypothetical protein KIS94_00840 [Chitinophagales bacterium]|nr:hypothetical protein [Chitinophagales bacterium]
MPNILNNNARQWLLSFAFGAVAFALTGLFWGMYLEDNEAIVAALHYGVLDEMGGEQYFSNFHTFLFPAIYQLGRLLPQVPVYGIFKMGFVLLMYAALIRYALGELERHQLKGSLNLLLLLLLVVIVVSDNALHLHCIRHSIVLSFAALLLNYQSIQRYGKTSAVAVVIFLIAVNTRSHSSAIMLACFGVFLLFSGMPVAKIVKHYWVMGAIAFFFLALYHIYGKYTTNMGKYIEAHYEYVLIEKPSLYPLANMKTAKDSAKYEAISQFFLSDSAELTIPFFDRVANTKYEQKPIFTKDNFAFAFNEIGHQSRAVLPVLSLWLLPFMGLFNKKLRQAGLRKTLAIILGAGLVLFSLLLILVNDMKPRFYSSFTAMVVFTAIMFYLPVFLQQAGKAAKGALLLILLCIGAWQWYSLRETAQWEREKEKQTQVHMRQLHAITAAQPVLMFMGSEIPFSSNPLYRSTPALYPKLASFDGGYLVYFSYGRKRFEKLFGISPVNFPAVIDMLKKQTDVLFYITPERLPLINRYFETVYGVTFTVEPVVPKPALDLNGTLYKVKVAHI